MKYWIGWLFSTIAQNHLLFIYLSEEFGVARVAVIKIKNISFRSDICSIIMRIQENEKVIISN